MKLKKIEVFDPNKTSWKPEATWRGAIILLTIIVIIIIAWMIIKNY
jgi:hypothetical protein